MPFAVNNIHRTAPRKEVNPLARLKGAAVRQQPEELGERRQPSSDRQRRKDFARRIDKEDFAALGGTDLVRSAHVFSLQRGFQW